MEVFMSETLNKKSDVKELFHKAAFALLSCGTGAAIGDVTAYDFSISIPLGTVIGAAIGLVFGVIVARRLDELHL